MGMGSLIVTYFFGVGDSLLVTNNHRARVFKAALIL